jgi:iron complex transport system ATP-binding protein
MTPAAPAAELRDVSVRSGDRMRLHPTTLRIQPGTVTAVVGRNGSGKSTLLGVLSGELEPTTGSALVAGAPVVDLGHAERAQRRSILAQETQVSFGFTVRDVVGWGRTPWRGTPLAEQDAEIVQEAMATQGLLDLADRPVTSLSGGERKRVHIARVTAQRADLLLLDEADADLDLIGRRVVDDLVVAHSRSGRTAVVVSHDIARVGHMCDQVVLMRAGRVHAAGAREAVLTEGLLSEAFDATVRVTWDDSGLSIRLP